MKHRIYGELSKKEKNYLRTSHLLGLKIETYLKEDKAWYSVKNPIWSDYVIYRVKKHEI